MMGLEKERMTTEMKKNERNNFEKRIRHPDDDDVTTTEASLLLQEWEADTEKMLREEK